MREVGQKVIFGLADVVMFAWAPVNPGVCLPKEWCIGTLSIKQEGKMLSVIFQWLNAFSMHGIWCFPLYFQTVLKNYTLYCVEYDICHTSYLYSHKTLKSRCWKPTNVSEEHVIPLLSLSLCVVSTDSLRCFSEGCLGWHPAFFSAVSVCWAFIV